MKRWASIVLAGAAAALAIGAGARTPPMLSCGSLSVGATAVSPGNARGAECLLQAYRARCRPAVYTLSRFGIDTIARDSFRVADAGGGCRIEVATTFTVVPQKPRPEGAGECSKLVRNGTDIVATGCTGAGLPTSVSLTGKS